MHELAPLVGQRLEHGNLRQPRARATAPELSSARTASRGHPGARGLWGDLGKELGLCRSGGAGEADPAAHPTPRPLGSHGGVMDGEE